MSEKQTIEAGNSLPPPLGSAGWVTSLDGERYDLPFYASRDEAIAGGRAEHNGEAFWIGLAFAPENAENFFDAEDWLENVACQDEYSGDHAKGWDMSTKEQRSELEKEVRAVMAAWIERHKLRPTFFNVRDSVLIEPNTCRQVRRDEEKDNG